MKDYAIYTFYMNLNKLKFKKKIMFLYKNKSMKYNYYKKKFKEYITIKFVKHNLKVIKTFV